MAINKRMFTLEFKVEAAHRVIDSGRSVSEVASELSLVEGSLQRWVREERRRIEASETNNQESLSAAERTELQRLRRQVAEQEKDLAFLAIPAAYFAKNPPKPRKICANGTRVRQLRNNSDGSSVRGI